MGVHMYQGDFKYTKTHEWVHLFKNHIARIGVTEHAQKQFGSVVYVDLPELDSEYEQFDSFIVIETENTLAEVISPLSGKVYKINEELDEDPAIINHDPCGDGWILELEITHENEIESLMDYDSYQKFLEEGGIDE
jgi:glycine cleavage system H protein